MKRSITAFFTIAILTICNIYSISAATLCSNDNVCNRNQFDELNANKNSSLNTAIGKKYTETTTKFGTTIETTRTYQNGDVFKYATDNVVLPGKYLAWGNTANTTSTGQSLIAKAEAAIVAGKGIKTTNPIEDVYTVFLNKAAGVAIIVINNKTTGQISFYNTGVLTKTELDKMIDIFEGSTSFFGFAPTLPQALIQEDTNKNLFYTTENDNDRNANDRERTKEKDVSAESPTDFN